MNSFDYGNVFSFKFSQNTLCGPIILDNVEV